VRPFQFSTRRGIAVTMSFVWTIRRLFLCVAMLAVFVGPMSIGLAGNAMAMDGAGSSMSMPGMNMVEKMPCCPDEHPTKPDCFKSCVLALLCTTSFTADTPHGASLPLSETWQSHRYEFLPAAQLTSALLEPPARPPKA